MLAAMAHEKRDFWLKCTFQIATKRPPPAASTDAFVSKVTFARGLPDAVVGGVKGAESPHAEGLRLRAPQPVRRTAGGPASWPAAVSAHGSLAQQPGALRGIRPLGSGHGAVGRAAQPMADVAGTSARSAGRGALRDCRHL